MCTYDAHAVLLASTDEHALDTPIGAFSIVVQSERDVHINRYRKADVHENEFTKFAREKMTFCIKLTAQN